MRNLHCRVCHGYIQIAGWMAHVSRHKNEFEHRFGKGPNNWEEVVQAFNGIPPEPQLSLKIFEEDTF